jgi:putative spermidine/putrescine transport system ATP-binding protein
MNTIPGVGAADGRVDVGAQSLPVDGPAPAVGQAVLVLARPEAVLIDPLTAGDVRASGDATVLVATFFGAVTRLRLMRDDGTELLADVASHRAPELTPGTAVRVSLLDRPVLVRASGAEEVEAEHH